MERATIIESALAKGVDPVLGTLSGNVLAAEWTPIAANAEQPVQVFTGPGVYIGFMVVIPGSSTCTVKVQDSNGTDTPTPVTLYTWTNPTSTGMSYPGQQVRMANGLLVTIANGGSGNAPAIVVFYKQFSCP